MVYYGIMTVYTVHQLATHAGISVRTLHHYDAIGLLKPARRGNGYREYGQEEVLRLQQILFFRELGFKLEDIRDILYRPDFDVLKALEGHRLLLQKRSERLSRLLETVDRTITTLRGETDMEIKEYYKGFSDEQVEEYRKEVRESWGADTLNESEYRVKAMGKEKFDEVQANGQRIFQAIADNMDKGPGSDVVQGLVAEWREWLEHFSHYTDEMVFGLGRSYSRDSRFAAYYHKIHTDLPEFFTKAIEAYCSKK